MEEFIINNTILKPLLIFSLFLFIVFLFSSSVNAHATLLDSTPTPNLVSANAPEEITLLFNEPVEFDLAQLTIYNWKAETVFIGQADETGARAPLVPFTIPDLADGTYTVSWSVVSLDGHPVSGSYAFAIGKPTKGDVKSVSNNKILDIPLIIARTIAQGLIILIAGLYWFSWFAANKQYPALNMIAPRGKSIVMVIIVLAIIAELVTYAIALPPGLIEIIVKGRWDLLKQFPFIVMVLAQFIFLLLLCITKMEKVWYLIIWFILTCVPAFGGHVWGMEHPIIGLIPRIIHQLAMTLWIGGLFYVILTIIYQKRVKKSLLPKSFRPFFVKRMIIASALVIISGIVMVFVQTSWSAVIFNWINWSTLLLIKIILTIFMLSIAIYQTLKWSKRKVFSTYKLIRMEWLIGLLIVFIGVVLSQINYPIAIKSYENTFVSDNMESSLKINQLKTGEQTMTIDFSTDKKVENIDINLSMPDHEMKSGPFSSDKLEDSVAAIKLPFTMSGTWEFGIIVQFEGGETTEWSDEVYVVGE